ncbi:hypothetical protein GIB67_042118, partial [Kingdonia uniflora]
MCIDPPLAIQVPVGMKMFRGSTVMSGYLKDSKATEDAFSSGWFYSGDLGVKHHDDYIELKDRCKDVIISGGENINAIERFINRSKPHISKEQQLNLTRWAVLLAGSLLKNNKVALKALMSSRLRVKLINFRWKKLAFVIEPGEIKLFCDGSSMGNPGPEGCGSVFRDHDGGLIGVLSMNLSAFKDSETGAISNRRRLVSGFGASVLEALVIVTPFEAKVILIYALWYDTVNELNSAKKSCGLEN